MTSVQAQEQIGKRPYEMVWANRTEDQYPALVDFENLDGWRAETNNAQATFVRSREQQIWGKYVGKLTYHATGTSPTVMIRPPKPIPCPTPFDTVTLWVYGNNWGWISDPTTPAVTLTAHFAAADGTDVPVFVYQENAKYWFLAYRKLTPDQQEKLKSGASFTGLEVSGGRNTADRTIYLDNLAVFKEVLKSLTFAPRPLRGIDMFPGETVGTNTGPGRLPFPTRKETILPSNLTAKFTTSVTRQGDAFIFRYTGDDGTLTYRLTPQTGTWSDITARWDGRGGEIHPCAGGGVYFAGDNDTELAPDHFTPLGTSIAGDTVVSRWRISAGPHTAEVTYTYHLWQKSLVIDVACPGGQIGTVRYGHAEGLENPREFGLPCYVIRPTRPQIVVSGPPDKPLFLSGHTDWYLSDASAPFGAKSIKDGKVEYNGGTLYTPKTDGKRNNVYERFFITVSPRFEEMLPTIANPMSPWKDVTGTGVWRAHGAGNRDQDIALWRKVHRYGLRHVIVTDHETGWRDEGESFTFRTRTAPGKGGDEGQYHYARVMQDELGFVYGPYNNYTDFAPVNQYWNADLIARTPDGQLQTAWPRCYAPKPARAVEYCEKLAPEIQKKFHFSTAYCDVHTAVAPWDRTDYDARVPGAGTFAATFYSYGEIMLLQKKAWNGPVYSEGGHHCYYVGLTDGNYGQDQTADLPNSPWLVDFDLRKMHDLACDFGMGNLGMFYGRNLSFGRTTAERDFVIDRFLAATVAFGHPGFLVFEGGYQNVLRSYYMIQQLAAAYTRASIKRIQYADADGQLLDSTAAVATGAYERDQIVNTYSNGCVTVVNGNKTERMRVTVDGRKFDLPPASYTGWSADKSVQVFAGDVDGHRIDYADTPDYLYIDGRGRFTRMAKAAGNGIGICRRTKDGAFEVIPYQGAECGFDIGAPNATAVARSEDSKDLGPAEVRVSRGLIYVMPVKDAFSYIVKPANQPAVVLTCNRDRVVAGETVTVHGKTDHQVQIPADAKPGDRVWRQFDGGWIDFTVVPLADADLTLEKNTLHLTLKANLSAPADGTVALVGQKRNVRFVPHQTASLDFDLGAPKREAADEIDLALQAGNLKGSRRWLMRVTRGYHQLADWPAGFTSGICLRGKTETQDMGQTRAIAHPESMSCGGDMRDGIFMHPPWMGGVGYTYIVTEPISLPQDPPAAFRCSVGKRDGSDPGDGILFKVAVVTADGKQTIVAQQHVIKHEWVPVQADLTPWRGQQIRLKLISDVGEKDDSSGDWSCWSGFRVETLDRVLVRELVAADTPEYRHVPGPYPMKGLTVADLRTARRAWLHYDGMGLEASDAYPTYAVINGIKVGRMAPAGGDETKGIWAENASVPLTAAAIASLGVRNKFRIENPAGDNFKIRRFWIELQLADGKKCSSDISTAVFTQPAEWRYFEGIGVPLTEQIKVDIWFDAAE